VIISPQLKGTEIIQNYVHDHVLRLGINGTYGERITPTGILEKDSAYTIGYQLDFKGKDWNKNNCTVVAILYDHKVKEVLQVETKKVIE
ncbi:MAG: Omp28-related outer membrane protein, partial [Anaerovorax sp.]